MGFATGTVPDGRRRLVEQLKRSGPMTPPELAVAMGITESAVRQHLEALSEHGLVESTTRKVAARGRPACEWHLSAVAQQLFPDRHADLTVELIESLRESLGEDALGRVIATREEHQRARYGEAIDRSAPIADRVATLAQLRADEGYMAEVSQSTDGIVLTEHHCPICEAASSCEGFCRSELDIFTEVLGEDVTVTRTSHLLSGGQRCTYLVTPKRRA